MKKTHILSLLIIIIAGLSCQQYNPVGPSELNGKIVFSMTTGATPYNSGQTHIYIINADGSGFKQLTFGRYEDMPRWSPDGSQIVFIADSLWTSLGNPLWIMNADGSNWRPVRYFPETHFAQPGEFPSWSPNGEKIVFDWCTHCEFGSRINDIYIVDLTTNQLKQLTYGDPWRDTKIVYPIGSNTSPVFTPDGKKIYFNSSRDDSINGKIAGVFSMNPDGTDVQKVIITSNSLDFYVQPIVSPNGKKIVFVHGDNLGNALFTSNIDGSNIVKIADPPVGTSVYSPRWLPEGKQIVFISGGSIFIINTDGTSLTRLPFDNIKTMYFDWIAN